MSGKPIALFIPALNGGGAQKVVVSLANQFVSLTDRPVHVVLAKKEGVFLSSLNNKVAVIDLGVSRSLASIWRLARYIKQQEPGVIMSSMNYANVICILAKILSIRKVRLVVREANVVTQYSVFDNICFCLINYLMRLLYPLADNIVANSPDTRDSLVNIIGIRSNKITTIGNPVDVDMGFSNISVSDVAPKIRKEPFVCAVGRLVKQKGFHDLIAAFADIKSRRVHLVVMGEGTYRDRLIDFADEMGVGDRVHFPGFVEHPEVIVKQSSGFILSSHWEGFGNVIVEALAVGVPVVSTDCPGGPRMILGDGEYGRLVPVGDIQSLTMAIDEMIETPVSTPELRRQRARDFAPMPIAKQYLDVLMPATHGLPDQ